MNHDAPECKNPSDAGDTAQKAEPMIALGTEQVLQLSPDDASAKAAKGLVVPAKWPRLEFDDQAVWGECQGSGSKPYQVQVDQTGPAFRCSCPSRKFPCKHGLALLLLLAQHRTSFREAEAPAWVAEWLASRRQRSESQAQKKTAADTGAAVPPADPAAAARREASRLQRMQGGLEELERWLADRLRQGLSQLPSQREAWDTIATRMVDAQLPGLAFRLRRTGRRVDRQPDWPARVLGELGRLQLLIDAFRRLDSLPPPVQQDLRAALGQPVERETVLAEGERVTDDWLVLGQAVEEEARLWTRRVWLHGMASGRRALLLDHAHGMRRFERSFVNGSCLRMNLAFHPGNGPLRALLRDDPQPATHTAAWTPSPLAAALDALADAVAANPWQWPQPLRLDDGVPARVGAGWQVVSPAGSLPLTLRDEDGWRLLALSGGHALGLFGEWDGEALRPLSAWREAPVWQAEEEAA